MNRSLALNAAAALLLLSSCTQQPGASPGVKGASYRPQAEKATLYRAQVYDPYYDYSGAIFRNRDYYWYGRPPFYVYRPYQRFDDSAQATSKPKAKSNL